MGQYVYTVAVAAIFSAVIISLCPGGEGGKFTKYIAFAGAITLLAVMLSPIPGFLESEFGEWDTGVANTESNKENTAEYYANSAGMVLFEIYGTPLSEISATVVLSDEGEVKKIVLLVDGARFFLR